MKIKILTLILMLIIVFSFLDAKPKQEKQKLDPEFESFWKEYKEAMIKNNETKLLEMSYIITIWAFNPFVDDISEKEIEDLYNSWFSNEKNFVQPESFSLKKVKTSNFHTIDYKTFLSKYFDINKAKKKLNLPYESKVIELDIDSYYIYFIKTDKGFKYFATIQYGE